MFQISYLIAKAYILNYFQNPEFFRGMSGEGQEESDEDMLHLDEWIGEIAFY